MARMISIVLLIGFCVGNASAAAPTRVGDSLVFEAEDWTTPREAWLADRDSEDHWNLSSKMGSANWSGGVALCSPSVRQDRLSPQAGAPALHTHLTGIPAGDYEIFLNRAGRKLAVSLDGTEWRPVDGNAEESLGVFRINNGTFDVWIDDRYATPWNIGPAWYDFIRLSPFKPPKLSHFQVWRLPQEIGNVLSGIPELTWISDRPVPTGVVQVEEDGKFIGLDSEPEAGQPKLRNHRGPFLLTKAVSTARVRVRIRFGWGFEWTSDPVEVAVPECEPLTERPGATVDVALNPAATIVPERPLVAGVPLAPGQLRSADGLVATDQAGSLLTQSNVAARWPDGSVHWLLTRFLPRPDSKNIRFRSGANPPAKDMHCEGSKVVGWTSSAVNNGLLSWKWGAERAGSGEHPDRPFSLFDRVARSDGERSTGEPELGNVRLIDGDGRAWGLGLPGYCNWEEVGPVRAVMCVKGHLRADDTQGLAYKLRYFFTANSPLVQVQLTITNDVKGPEFQRIRSLAFRIPIAGDGSLRGQLAGCEPVEIRATGGLPARADTGGQAASGTKHTGGQAASGTKQEPGQHEIWQLDDKNVRVINKGRSSVRQERSLGWAVVQRGDNEIAFALRDLWQTWPKSLALKPDGLHVRLLPDMSKDKREYPNLMDWARQGYAFDEDGCYLLRRGIALRHEFWVRFGQAGEIDKQGGPAAWAARVLAPQYASVTPEQYCQSGVFGPVQTAARDARPEYEAMVERSVRGMLGEREANGEYGWMNFGDWHGERTYNWGNNEYDLSWAMALQFARTGRWDYFQVGDNMSRHYAIIDSIHVPSDPHMPGRVWPHSFGHVGMGDRMPASNSAREELKNWFAEGDYNQRFYQGIVDPGGHIFQPGNFAYYFLTGDRDLLETAEMVCSAQAQYLTPQFEFGIERAAGWPLINAVEAYEATCNPFYLNAARIYIERVLQKHDPVGGGWLLPQPVSECDGKPGVGGKAFATGILLYGMMRYDLVEPRQDVESCIVDACRWLVDQTWNEQKQGFRYKTGCDKYRDDSDNGGTTTSVCVSGLVYGYKLSGNERFADVARKGLARLCKSRSSFGKATGMVCRQSPFALPGLPATRPE